MTLQERLERLSEFVDEVRARKDLSLEKIREAGGPSLGWLSQLKNGQLVDEPKPATLKKLAKGLGVPLLDVILAFGADYYDEQPGGGSISLTLKAPGHNPDAAALPVGKYPATPDERRIYEAAHALGIVTFSLKLPEFWDWTPEERRPTFRNLEGLIEEERRNQARFKHG